MTIKAVKLDDETFDRLKTIAETKRRSPHWMMKEAIRQFVEREEAAESIRQETLERWARYETGGEAVDHEDVAAWLETWGTDKEGPWIGPRS